MQVLPPSHCDVKRHSTHSPEAGSQIALPPSVQSASVVHSTQVPVAGLQIGAPPPQSLATRHSTQAPVTVSQMLALPCWQSASVVHLSVQLLFEQVCPIGQSALVAHSSQLPSTQTGL